MKRIVVELVVLGEGEPEREDDCVSDGVSVGLSVASWLPVGVALLEGDPSRVAERDTVCDPDCELVALWLALGVLLGVPGGVRLLL